MTLQKRFRKYIADQQLFQKEDSLLVAVSGGVDSMALCRLLMLENYSFSVAHCNFQLRGDESEQDAKFVHKTLEKSGVKIYMQTFETLEYADTFKLGVQEAARNLRYAWFEELRSVHKYQYILTAHHGNDQIETVIYNFTKGTGIHGLHGILPKNGVVVRPLLFALKNEIEEFAAQYQVDFRQDASNLQDKYKRNQIRLHIIPQLKTINPSFEQTALENIDRLKSVEAVYQWGIEKIKSQAVIEEGDIIKISQKVILTSPAPSSVLYEIIKAYDFNGAQAVDILGKMGSGRIFYSSNYRLLADRAYFYIQKLNNDLEIIPEYIIDLYNGSWETPDAYFEWATFSDFEIGNSKQPEVALLDSGRLNFPLRLRRWKAGDWFQPYGLKGKTQKLSDFFNNQKLSKFDKEKIWILESGSGDICWIAGWRVDHRFKAGKETAAVIKFAFQIKY